VRVRITNLGEAPVRLDAGWFNLVTGLDASAHARFYKHGYQSWSASGAELARERRGAPEFRAAPSVTVAAGGHLARRFG